MEYRQPGLGLCTSDSQGLWFLSNNIYNGIAYVILSRLIQYFLNSFPNELKLLKFQKCTHSTCTYDNKVIRPKSRALALSKNVRQTDGQTIFFQKHFLKGFLLLQVSSLPFRAIKNAIKSFKNDFVTDRRNDRPTDRPTDGPTDKVAYRVAQHATKNIFHLNFILRLNKCRWLTNYKSRIKEELSDD